VGVKHDHHELGVIDLIQHPLGLAQAGTVDPGQMPDAFLISAYTRVHEADHTDRGSALPTSRRTESDMWRSRSRVAAPASRRWIACTISACSVTRSARSG
jgi:hypothetical protein